MIIGQKPLMTDFMEISVLKNLLSDDISDLIHEKIISLPCWKISTNGLLIEKFQEKHNSADNGLIICSYEKNLDLNEDKNLQELNFYAGIVLNLCLKKIQLKDVIVKRMFWNYYHGSSIGTYHADSLQKNHWSVVFYINDNVNSGTIIKTQSGEEVLINHEKGSAVLFPSSFKHMGKMSMENKHRCCLNIVFEATASSNIKINSL
jgi:hypothetical protein